jgi:hypothetical protein
MAYNLLSGTVVANEAVLISPIEELNKVEGQFHGDGTNITNVARVVANGTTDYLVSIGANADSLVGEPNLRFNGSRLLVVGSITGSTMNLTSIVAGSASASSYLALDENNNVVLTSSSGGSGGGGGGSANAQGPVNSLQFNTGSGGISGSANLTFTGDQLFVTGNLIVSGNIEANTFEIISTTVTEINQSGSTAFGDTNDDTHHFTGSLSIFSSSTDLFSVSSLNKITKIKTGIVFNRTIITSDYSVLKTDYYIGVDTNTPSAVITASLPNASTLNEGQTFVFKDEGGAANTYNIVISASVGQTIDSQNQVILESPHASLTLYTDGSSKFFIT